MVVVNLTFSICERFSCAILLIYSRRMAVNRVNVLINFFLLYIIILSKVVGVFFVLLGDFFLFVCFCAVLFFVVFVFSLPKMLLRKRIFCLVLFLISQTLMANFPEIQGGKLIWQNADFLVCPNSSSLWVGPLSDNSAIQCFHSCSCFSLLVLYSNLLFL